MIRRVGCSGGVEVPAENRTLILDAVAPVTVLDGVVVVGG